MPVPQKPLYMESSPPDPDILRLLRPIGYGLLLLNLFDTVAMLVPPRFMNAQWEVQRFGELVERIVVPLLAFTLIFYGQQYLRSRYERVLVRILSWFCLLYGLVLLGLMPLSIVNLIRLETQATAQFNLQQNQRLEQIELVEQQIEQFNDAQLAELARQRQLGSQGSPAELKQRLQADLKQRQQRQVNDAQTQRKTQVLTFRKNILKWELGALISGVLLIYLWRWSHWARSPFEAL